jgi:hypothetical protein
MMSITPNRYLRRVSTLLAGACLTLGLASCGDSDDRSTQSVGDTPTETGSQQVPADTRSDGAKVAPGEATGGGSKPRLAGKTALAGDREQARASAAAIGEVYDDLDQAVAAGIASVDVPARDTLDAAARDESLTAVCDLMSRRAQRQTVVYAKRSAGLADVKWTCEKATALMLRRAGQTGSLKRATRVEIVGVNAQGDRATATIRRGGVKGSLTTVALVREDGEWKLAASP